LGALIRIGVLTPHRAIGPEAEFPAMAPGRVVTCVARVSARGTTGQPAASELRALTASPLDEAAATLGASSVDAVAYASTTSAYAIGFEAEEALVSRLAGLGTPVASTCASTVMALRVLGAERVALVHPPWFDTEENELGTAYFRSQGFDVVSTASAELPDDPRRISAADVYEWTCRNTSGDAEALFIGGNGFRAAAAVATLETELGRPVLTANQVLLWNLLAEVGAAFEVGGYGRLFAHAPQLAGR
jgi:maleate isomerase